MYRIMVDALTQLHFDYASTTWSYLTMFFPMSPFDPYENIRKPLVFWCFQGDQKGTLGRKELINGSSIL